MDQIIKENDEYAVHAVEEVGCLLSIKVTIKPKSAQKAYQKAVKLVNKQISIPGFRKGHAPDRTVISRYGNYVENEWKEILVNDAYRAALDLTNIYPMNKDSVYKPKIEKCSEEEGALVLIAYEHYPQIPLIDFSALQLPPVEKKVVSESDIQEVLQEIGITHAEWEIVEGRSVEEGDYVDVSIDSIEEGSFKEIVKERRFEVNKNRLPGWLKNRLIGLNSGESVEAESELDEEAEEHTKQNFKPTKVRIILHTIQKILLPEVNDELAKKAGVNSVEELKNKILGDLDQEAEEARTQKRIEGLEAALLEAYVFDLPASLVESERKSRLAQEIQALHDQHVPEEQIKQREAQIERQVNSEIDHDLRLYFLNKQIAKQGEIAVTNQELNEELMRHVSRNPYLYKETDQAATRQLVSRIATVLVQRKAKKYALSQIEAA